MNYDYLIINVMIHYIASIEYIIIYTYALTMVNLSNWEVVYCSLK